MTQYLTRFPETKKQVWKFGEVNVAGVTLRIGDDKYRVLVIEFPPMRMGKEGMSPCVPDMRDAVDFRKMFFADDATVVLHCPQPSSGLNRLVYYQRLTGPTVPCDERGYPRRPKVIE